jgi:multidrug efflux pump subunit AcrA (membrane-fusion protein)
MDKGRDSGTAGAAAAPAASTATAAAAAAANAAAAATAAPPRAAPLPPASLSASTFLSSPAGLAAWLQQTCLGIDGTLAAIIVTAGREAGSFSLSSAWPGQAAGLHLVALSERCLVARGLLQHDAGGALAVATPLLGDDGLHGVLVIEVATATLGAGEIVAAVTVAGRYLNQVVLGHAATAEDPAGDRLRLYQELLRQICQPAPFHHAALETVNWLAARLQCTRVALGMTQRGAIRLQALSHSAWFDRHSHMVAALEHAMEEALDQRRSVAVPPVAGMQAVLSIAHRTAAAGLAACSVVLAGGGGLGAGALYFERPPAQPFTLEEVQTLEQLAQLAGPVLEAKRGADRWLGGRSVDAWQRLGARLRDPRRPALRLGLGALLLALAALTLVDTTWHIGAAAAIEGQQQRAVPAPFEGFLARADTRAGMVVRRGQPLAALDTRQLHLDQQRWAAEEAQHDSQYRDGLSRHDRPAAAMALAQMRQAQAQRALAEDKLDQAELRAPFDAYVVSGDLSQHIGSPVEQGKVLFELAPLDAYRVIVKVDERDIRAVRVGQRGTLLLAGLTGERLPFTVSNIALAEALDGRNVFRVEARLDQAHGTLRPGMQGVAKIAAGQHSLLWIWTHAAWQWLQLQAWKWGP